MKVTQSITSVSSRWMWQVLSTGHTQLTTVVMLVSLPTWMGIQRKFFLNDIHVVFSLWLSDSLFFKDFFGDKDTFYLTVEKQEMIGGRGVTVLVIQTGVVCIHGMRCKKCLQHARNVDYLLI